MLSVSTQKDHDRALRKNKNIKGRPEGFNINIINKNIIIRIIQPIIPGC